jgi:DNA-binding beta-propeller fold protein YncE
MKKYFVLFIALILIGYTRSFAELADTIWTHKVPRDVINVRFSPDGKYIYAGSTKRNGFELDTNRITKIDAVTNKEVYKIPIPTTLTRMVLSQDGKYIIFAYDTLVKVYNTETKEELKTFILPMLSGNNRYSSIPALVGLSISFDNKYLGAVCGGGNINPNPKDRAQSNLVIWNFETGKEVYGNIESEYFYDSFSFSPTEDKYAIG